MTGTVRCKGKAIISKSGFKLIRFSPQLRRLSGKRFQHKDWTFDTSDTTFNIVFNESDIVQETMTAITISKFELSDTNHNVRDANSEHLERFRTKYGDCFTESGIDLTQFNSMDVIDLSNITKVECPSVDLTSLPVFDITQDSARKIGEGLQIDRLQFGSGYGYHVVPNYYHRIHKNPGETKLLVKAKKANNNVLFLKFNHASLGTLTK